ncbi:hypothetical protein [Tanapox virus]|uniref:Uncharacterized protein 131R n=1 Tax=Tanapox virus TaxID=99000 RepID=A7XCR8_9POXV|nr:hypothetical protein [Tanapox virus]ABQ43762.1 hypothetical protein [Tanapox virus]
MSLTTLSMTITIKEDSVNIMGSVPIKDNSNININILKENKKIDKNENLYIVTSDTDTISNDDTEKNKK